MHVAEVIALAYRYPHPSARDELAAAIAQLDSGAVQRHLENFLRDISELELGRWEELHTATLDLSPQFVPYVGHVTWGENYRRGEFMADMNAQMRAAGIPLHGELPDHIEPFLRYLASVDEPFSDLVEVLPGAVAMMQDTLADAAPKNPYRHLVDATAAFTADLRPLTIGGTR